MIPSIDSRPTNRFKRTYGFTLIEVLVALLVLSIGLLGLAALQATGLRLNHSAYLRSQASLLAYDIADRMRANRDSAEQTTHYVSAYGDQYTRPNCTSTSATCSADDIATFDLAEWKSDLVSLLPSGDGRVTRETPVAGRIVFVISVRWNDDRRSNVADYKTFALRTEL